MAVNSVCIAGKFYGTTKAGNSKSSGKRYFRFSIGQHNTQLRRMEYFRCVAYGALAELCEKHHRAKDTITIGGRLTSYDMGEGENKSKITEVWVQDVDMSGAYNRGAFEASEEQKKKWADRDAKREDAKVPDDDDDLPW